MTSMKTSETPVVGAYADHRFVDVDPREVVEVNKNGTRIRLWILGAPSNWLPARNYTYRVFEA